MLKTSYIGNDYEWNDSLNVLRLMILPGNDPMLLSLRLKLWQKGTLMSMRAMKEEESNKASSLIHDNLPRLSIQATESDAGAISGKIKEVDIAEDGTITAYVIFHGDHLTKALDISTPRQDIRVHPDTYRTGFEFRLQQFRHRHVTRSIDSTSASNSFILRQLLGEQGAPNKNATSEQQPIQSDHQLTVEQSRVINTLTNGAQVVFQEAPAGTGKTYVISIYGCLKH